MRRRDDHGAAVHDEIAPEQRPAPRLEETDVIGRVPGRVHDPQRRLARHHDVVIRQRCPRDGIARVALWPREFGELAGGPSTGDGRRPARMVGVRVRDEHPRKKASVARVAVPERARQVFEVLGSAGTRVDQCRLGAVDEPRVGSTPGPRAGIVGEDQRGTHGGIVTAGPASEGQPLYPLPSALVYPLPSTSGLIPLASGLLHGASGQDTLRRPPEGKGDSGDYLRVCIAVLNDRQAGTWFGACRAEPTGGHRGPGLMGMIAWCVRNPYMRDIM